MIQRMSPEIFRQMFALQPFVHPLHLRQSLPRRLIGPRDHDALFNTGATTSSSFSSSRLPATWTKPCSG